MDTQELGTQHLEKLTDFSADFGNELAKSLEDGKFQLTEALGFIDEAAQLIGVAKSFKQIEAEIKDIDESEKAALVQRFAERFDISNDKAEVLIEKCLLHALTTVDIVNSFKELRAAKNV